MNKTIRIASATLAVVAMLSTAACDKFSEPYKDDASRGASNFSPADTVSISDRFSNYTTKCDNGNRVYVLFHSNGNYGSIAVVPSDPSCKVG